MDLNFILKFLSGDNPLSLTISYILNAAAVFFYIKVHAPLVKEHDDVKQKLADKDDEIKAAHDRFDQLIAVLEELGEKVDGSYGNIHQVLQAISNELEELSKTIDSLRLDLSKIESNDTSQKERMERLNNQLESLQGKIAVMQGMQMANVGAFDVEGITRVKG